MSGVDNRKDLLLLLLYLPGPSGEPHEPLRGRTRLMKLLYLLENDARLMKLLKVKAPHAFEPFTFGPFSKDVLDDVYFLKNTGLVGSEAGGAASGPDAVEDNKVISDVLLEETDELPSPFQEEEFALSSRGLAFVKKALLPHLPQRASTIIEETKRRFAGIPLSSLLSYVYRRYPDSASKSILKHLAS